jgi:hypothetical protein
MYTATKAKFAWSAGWLGSCLVALPACSGGDPERTDDPSTDAEQATGFVKTFEARGGTVATGEFETPYGRQRLTYTEIDGERIFEGDIILPKDRPEYRSGATYSFDRLWPNGIVPYESTGLFNDQRVRDAIAHWHARTPHLEPNGWILEPVLGARGGHPRSRRLHGRWQGGSCRVASLERQLVRRRQHDQHRNGHSVGAPGDVPVP